MMFLYTVIAFKDPGKRRRGGTFKKYSKRMRNKQASLGTVNQHYSSLSEILERKKIGNKIKNNSFGGEGGILFSKKNLNKF